MKNKILALGLVLALVAVMVMPLTALAATTDTVGGSFLTGSNTPVVTVTLYDEAGTTPVTSMTPYTPYTVKVNVTDADQKANLNTITLKLWYDADGGAPTSGEFDSAAAGVSTGLIITWTQSDNHFTLTGPTSTTWALGTCVAPDTLPADFEFKFTVGKVATETTGSANWQIAAKVLDRVTPIPNNIFAYDSDTGTNTMNFYGEIAVTNTSVSWGSVTAPMAFAEGAPSEQAVGNINYISNGVYYKKVSTTATWSATSQTATLDPLGNCSTANQFALKAAVGGTLPGSEGLVTTTGVNVGSGTITSELGVSDAANGLWLKLASTFAGGNFQGTVTYTISNTP